MIPVGLHQRLERLFRFDAPKKPFYTIIEINDFVVLTVCAFGSVFLLAASDAFCTRAASGVVFSLAAAADFSSLAASGAICLLAAATAPASGVTCPGLLMKLEAIAKIYAGGHLGAAGGVLWFGFVCANCDAGIASAPTSRVCVSCWSN